MLCGMDSLWATYTREVLERADNLMPFVALEITELYLDEPSHDTELLVCICRVAFKD